MGMGVENRGEELEREDWGRLHLGCRINRKIKKKTPILPTCNTQMLFKYVALQFLPLARMKKR